jgi:hypothetical protein
MIFSRPVSYRSTEVPALVSMRTPRFLLEGRKNSFRKEIFFLSSEEQFVLRSTSPLRENADNGPLLWPIRKKEENNVKKIWLLYTLFYYLLYYHVYCQACWLLLCYCFNQKTKSLLKIFCWQWPVIVSFVFLSDTQVDDTTIIDSHRVMIGFVIFGIFIALLRFLLCCPVHRHGEKVNFQILFLPYRLIVEFIFLFESLLYGYIWLLLYLWRLE